MNFLLPFFGGVLLGWLAEWVIDWLYWRERRETKVGQLAGEENSRLRQELDRARAEISRLQAELAAKSNGGGLVEQVLVRDHLEKVSGIGPVFARKLNEANINTFAALANLTPQRIHEIIQPQSWQKIEAETWITQARILALKSASEKEQTLL